MRGVFGNNVFFCAFLVFVGVTTAFGGWSSRSIFSGAFFALAAVAALTEITDTIRKEGENDGDRHGGAGDHD